MSSIHCFSLLAIYCPSRAPAAVLAPVRREASPARTSPSISNVHPTLLSVGFYDPELPVCLPVPQLPGLQKLRPLLAKAADCGSCSRHASWLTITSVEPSTDSTVNTGPEAALSSLLIMGSPRILRPPTDLIIIEIVGCSHDM